VDEATRIAKDKAQGLLSLAQKEFDKHKERAFNIIKQAKNVFEEHIKKVENFVMKALKEAANLLPSLESLEIGRLYIECLINPIDCDTSLTRLPTFTVCLSKIGCLHFDLDSEFRKMLEAAELLQQNKTSSFAQVSTFPGHFLGEFAEIIRKKVFNRIETWARGLVTFTDVTKFLPGEISEINFPNFKMVNKAVTFPVPELIYDHFIVKKEVCEILGPLLDMARVLNLPRHIIDIIAKLKDKIKGCKFKYPSDFGHKDQTILEIQVPEVQLEKLDLPKVPVLNL
jgi:hypothetical protein